MTARVTPDASGIWLAVVGPAGALLVAHAADRADELLIALSASDPAQAVLDVLAGSGVSVAPDFALVLTDDAGRPRHAVVRGSAVVELPDQTLTGVDARTWMEHGMDAATAVLVAPVADDGPALPLEHGAVRGGRIELGTTGSPAAIAPADDPAPLPPPSAAAIIEHTMVEPDDGPAGYDHLFEATIVRPVEAAAMRPELVDEEPDTARPDAASLDDGDHDGETVLSSGIPGRAQRARPEPHEIAGAPAERRFALVLPGGRREPIVGELIAGRAPTARVVDGRMPRLVTLDGDPDVSRSHLRIALEGDTVVVTDLRSRNGTSVVLPGKPAQLLRADEPTPVIPGTVLDLGATQLVVEEEPTTEGPGA